MKKGIVFIIMSLFMVLLLVQVCSFAKNKPRLNYKGISIYVGQKVKLKVINKPKHKRVKWYSKNKKIVAVSKKGRIVAKKKGKTTIIAKIKKKKYKCKVNVLSKNEFKQKKDSKSIIYETTQETTSCENTSVQEGVTQETEIPEITTQITTTPKITTQVTTTPEITTQATTTPEITTQVITAPSTTTQTENDIVKMLSANMNIISHRGYSSIAPENTIDAFRLAKQKGYNIVETDVKFTKDGVPIMLHDSTINRVARNKDGTEIAEPVRIADITYEEALSYDFGIYKSQEYKGTKILTYEDFLKECKELNLSVYMHLHVGSRSQIEYLFNRVCDYGLKEKVTWYSFASGLVSCVRDCDNTVRLGLAKSIGITPEIINQVEELRKYGNPVFLNSSTYSEEEIKLCKDAGIPLEVWFVNSLERINSLNSYISGVTVDYIR